MKKIVSIILAFVILLSLSSCTFLYDTINPEYEKTYYELRQLMLFVNADPRLLPSGFFWSDVDNALEDLPSNYRDVKQIREDYIYIKSQFDILFNEENSYESRHSAAMNLLKSDYKYQNWDLTKAINLLAGHNSGYILSILYGEWRDSYGNYFAVYENGVNDIWISYNLPVNTEKDKDYSYTFYGNMLYFQEKDNKDNMIKAFYISDISYSKITVFCYSDNRYYYLANNNQ